MGVIYASTTGSVDTHNHPEGPLPQGVGVRLLFKERKMENTQAPMQLFADEAGHMVEVMQTSTAETVEFAPQGGGFIRKASRVEFERRFKPAKLPAFSLVAIGADWLPDGMKVQAYANGRRWNGWAMPYFTIEEARSLLEFMPGLRYDSARDAFINAHEDQAEEDVYPAVTLVIGGISIKTYAIGTGCWCWYLAE